MGVCGWFARRGRSAKGVIAHMSQNSRSRDAAARCCIAADRPFSSLTCMNPRTVVIGRNFSASSLEPSENRKGFGNLAAVKEGKQERASPGRELVRVPHVPCDTTHKANAPHTCLRSLSPPLLLLGDGLRFCPRLRCHPRAPPVPARGLSRTRRNPCHRCRLPPRQPRPVPRRPLRTASSRRRRCEGVPQRSTNSL